MKLSTKITAAGAAGVLVALAAAAPAMAADGDATDTQTVTAAIDSVLSVTVDGTAAFGALDPTAETATTIDAGTVTVSGNLDYSLTVTDEGGLHTGDPDDVFLQTPLKISDTTDGSATGLADTPTAISDTPGTPDETGVALGSNTAGNTDVFTISLAQQALLTDPVSTDYSDLLTYTASPQL